MTVADQHKTPLAAEAVMAVVGIALGGCVVDSAIDCSHVCDKYQDCVDPDYDVSACDSRCDGAGENAARRREIDACDSCIDDQTCGAGAHGCDDECAGILP